MPGAITARRQDTKREPVAGREGETEDDSVFLTAKREKKINLQSMMTFHLKTTPRLGGLITANHNLTDGVRIAPLTTSLCQIGNRRRSTNAK